MTVSRQTPSQTVGPYFAYGLTPDVYSRRPIVTGVLVDADTPGQHIRLTGRVLDGNGQPVEDAMLEIWQADADGRYAHPLDDARGGKRADDRFRGFGRVGTTPQGEFTFQTIKPGAVPGPGNSQQAPHLNLILFSRGLLTHAFTRVYFNDEDEANDLDPILNLVEPARRGSIIAQRDKDAPHPTYRLDIHLQGDNETVFLEA